jgi:hypothetical protein
MAHLTEVDRWSANLYFAKRKTCLLRRVAREVALFQSAIMADEIIAICTMVTLKICNLGLTLDRCL